MNIRLPQTIPFIYLFYTYMNLEKWIFTDFMGLETSKNYLQKKPLWLIIVTIFSSLLAYTSGLLILWIGHTRLVMEESTWGNNLFLLSSSILTGCSKQQTAKYLQCTITVLSPLIEYFSPMHTLLTLNNWWSAGVVHATLCKRESTLSVIGWMLVWVYVMVGSPLPQVEYSCLPHQSFS